MAVEVTISLSQRQQASDIIKELRKTLSRKQIAEFVGINPCYISFALTMKKRTDEWHEVYLCPKDAIHKILTYALKETMLSK